MNEQFVRFSLIGVNILTVILAGIIFLVVMSWYQVLTRYLAANSDARREAFYNSVKLAVIWTIFVLVVILIVFYLSLNLDLKYIPDSGGRNVSDLIDDGIMPMG